MHALFRFDHSPALLVLLDEIALSPDFQVADGVGAAFLVVVGCQHLERVRRSEARRLRLRQ